jgi:hypothetical protein
MKQRVWHFGPQDKPIDVIIEAPHASYDKDEWMELRGRLEKLGVPASILDSLESLHKVKSDVGSGNIAQAIAAHLQTLWPNLRIAVLMGDFSRVVVDFNRLAPGEGMTPPIPSEIQGEARKWLAAEHLKYLEEADALWGQLGPNGWGICPHTYAPRGVAIPDGMTAAQAAQAFWSDTEAQERSPLRSPVDIIWQRPDTDTFQHKRPKILDRIKRALEDALKVVATENKEFSMLEVVTADLRMAKHPGQVVCFKVRRDLVVDPHSGGWQPGEFMEPNLELCGQIGAAIARAFIEL